MYLTHCDPIRVLSNFCRHDSPVLPGYKNKTVKRIPNHFLSNIPDDHFSVDSSGIITNNKQLDADNNNAYYEFVVTAKDKGEPAKTGTATVRVYTKNKNDEEPKFSQQVYTPNVDENAGPNTLVTTVVASDKDGDNVRFGFVGGGTTSGQFVIEEITGVIRLHNKAISLDRDKYELNVTALDDGACCVNGDATIHTSTAVVVVFITDVNDNKPMFKDCATYFPKVEEGAPNGSPVIKVHATDEDKGVNGQVKYSIVQQPNQKGTKFTVDEETGEVSTNKVFDREGDDGKFVSVTVKATDQGEPSLEGVCSFTVEITDVNDNPPLFDRQVSISIYCTDRHIYYYVGIGNIKVLYPQIDILNVSGLYFFQALSAYTRISLSICNHSEKTKPNACFTLRSTPLCT